MNTPWIQLAVGIQLSSFYSGNSQVPSIMKRNGKVVPFKQEQDRGLRDLKEFLRANYDIRFNSVTEKSEFKRNGEPCFISLEDYYLNSIFFNIKSNGIKVSIDTLRRLLESDFAEKENPIKSYIQDLPRCVGITNIEKIINTVDFEAEEEQRFFRKVFPKWFVALVANVFDEDRCTNHTCLVFTGAQGKRKTTWFNQIIPPELDPYKFNGKIDPNSKDTLALIHSKLLIIIDDQLKQINKKDENDIKELITKDKVTYRKPFAVFDMTRPHLASFAATVNGDDFLTDATGSRRFLSFCVQNCNVEKLKEVDLAKAYAEAYHLYLSGFRYWFNDDEVAEINQKNEEFTSVSIEMELIDKYFDADGLEREFYSAGEIKLYLEAFTKDYISTKRIGEVLSKLGVKRISVRDDQGRIRKKYPIKKRTIC